jgi:LacI family transcriptional regulator, gluconate utilization system Gnt-I transcriptional repressor
VARRLRPAAGRSPERHRAATLAEVAKLARVSPMTASRAINQPDLVAPDTAARVRAAAEQLAYIPNRIAGGLSSQKSRIVIAVIPSTLNPVFADMVEALRADLLRADYELFLGLSDYAVRREDELVDKVIGRRPDGIVLTGVMHSPRVRWRLDRAHIPVVETWDLTPSPIDMLVGFSNEEVGRSAAERFLARGRTKLALIIADDQRAQLRRQGFVGAVRERGVAVAGEVVLRAPTTVGMAREALSRLLAADPGIDAVFCSSDQLAMGVLYEASARAIPVPQRLAVIGFGNLSASAYTHPSLTTVAVDGGRIGREAARLLVDRLDGKVPRPKKPQILDVGSAIIARESG